VPETMRFNGNGYYGGSTAVANASCDMTVTPAWNSRTITTGAEIGNWIWNTYLAIDDKTFLTKNYPLMKGAAQYLLGYAGKAAADGKLHTTANAHETQWNVKDPVTDVVSMETLFPNTVAAAGVLGVDASLIKELNAAIKQIPPLPRTDTATQKNVLTPASDADGKDMIAISAQPAVPTQNMENLGLEPVWPYGAIGDDSGSLTDLGKRTYDNRRWKNTYDWTDESLQAARLGLADAVKTDLIANTKTYQVGAQGMAELSAAYSGAPYLEQSGVVAAALDEALVQDYDGLLRIAPAWPSDWDVDGTVYIQHNTKVHVQVRGGAPSTVAVESGFTGKLRVRNPWPTQSVTVIDGAGTPVTTSSSTSFEIPVTSGTSYLIEQTSNPTTALTFAQVGGAPAISAKYLGERSIGLAGRQVGGTATQSSTRAGATADRVIDGNTDGVFDDGSVSHTNDDLDAWWQEDLGASHDLHNVRIYPRTDCCTSRLSNFWVFASAQPFDTTLTPAKQATQAGVSAFHYPGAATADPLTIALSAPGTRYILIQLDGTNYLSLAEVDIG